MTHIERPVWFSLPPRPLTTLVFSPSDCYLALSDHLGWLSRADQERLNELVRLGFHYSELKFFASRDRSEGQAHSSHYRRALCSGLAELLEVYQATVLSIQREVQQVTLDVLGGCAAGPQGGGIG